MCGIAGIVLSPDQAGRVDVPGALGAMSRRIAHRGPDGEGYWVWDGADRMAAARSAKDLPEGPWRVGLAHRRLSILDLSEAAHQPISADDGRHHLVFNGEIYNYIELREELQKLGHTFRSSGDTEALLHALAEWGGEATTKLDGMFAFAWVDRQKQTLTLARDFVGIKPLYETAWSGGWAFSSEMKALLELEGVGRDVCRIAASDFLSLGLTDHRPQSLIQTMRRVPPGRTLAFAMDGTRRDGATHWAPGPRGSKAPATVDALASTFAGSIRLHLRSDVEVGTALSGGIDSSAVVCNVRQILGDSGVIRAFGYVDDDPALSERPFMEQVSAHARAELAVTTPSPNELAAEIDALIITMDEPFTSTSVFAQSRVFRLAREHGIKVMLDGQGADELFAGYRFYLAVYAAELVRQGRWSKLPRLFAQSRGLRGTSPLSLLAGTAALVGPRSLRNRAASRTHAGWLNHSWLRDGSAGHADAFDWLARPTLVAALASEFCTYRLPRLLRYEDRNSMAHGVESRVPFVTKAMFQLAQQCTSDQLSGPHGRGKEILREACRGVVPDAILDRKDKVGFETSEAKWMRAIAHVVDGWFDEGIADLCPAVNAEKLTAHWAAFRDGHAKYDKRLWRTLCLLRWMALFGVKA